jgi:hypothetical protein
MRKNLKYALSPNRVMKCSAAQPANQRGAQCSALAEKSASIPPDKAKHAKGLDVQAHNAITQAHNVKIAREIWKKLPQLGLILMMGMSLSANAGWFGLGDLSWKEEVRLNNGKIIVIERDQINESGGDEWALNRSGGKPKEYRIRFASPSGTRKMTEWRSTKKDDGMWPEVPLFFDFISEQPTIFSLVAIPNSNCCEVYSKYIYRNGAWVEEPLPEKFSPHASNLFFGTQKNMPSFLSLAEKAKRSSDSGYRQALKQIGPARMVTFP